MYLALTICCSLAMAIFPCGAKEAGCTECTSSQSESNSLLQAKVAVNSAMHSHALEVAAAMKEIHQKPSLGLNLIRDFAVNAIGTETAIDNSTWGVIRSINKSLQTDIIKTIMDDHALDENAITNEVKDAADSCVQQFSQDKASDTNEGVKAAAFGADHRSLRDSLKVTRSNRTDHCTKMKKTVTGVPSYACSPPTPPADDHALADSQVVESYKQKLEQALAALTPFDAQKKSCVRTIDEQEKARSASVAKQTVLETSMCTWRIASLQSCLTYDECYQTLQDTLTSDNHWLVSRVQHRKLELETIDRIQCILTVLVVDDKTTTSVQRKQMLKDCHTKAVNVSHLNITIPKLPEKQPCDLSAVATYPGTADFHDSWYKDSDGKDYPDLQEVTPCIIPDKLKAVKDTTASTASTIGGCVAAALGTCAVGQNGVLQCWGKNRYGEDTVPADLGVSGMVSGVEKGEELTCVQLAATGKARCWPSRWYGSRLPRETELEEFGPVRNFAVGAYGACFVAVNGTLRCWDYRKTGTGSYEHIPENLHDVHTIAAGHVGPVCAVNGVPGEPGQLFCWAISRGAVPGNVGLVKTVSVKRGTACVIKSDDTVQCFCLSTYGCGGDHVPGSIKASAVAAGGNGACAILLADQTVLCWGGLPAPPNSLGAVTTLVAGYSHACAVRSSDQHLVCWGSGAATNVPNDLGAVSCPTKKEKKTTDPRLVVPQVTEMGISSWHNKALAATVADLVSIDSDASFKVTRDANDQILWSFTKSAWAAAGLKDWTQDWEIEMSYSKVEKWDGSANHGDEWDLQLNSPTFPARGDVPSGSCQFRFRNLAKAHGKGLPFVHVHFPGHSIEPVKYVLKRASDKISIVILNADGSEKYAMNDFSGFSKCSSFDGGSPIAWITRNSVPTWQFRVLKP